MFISSMRALFNSDPPNRLNWWEWTLLVLGLVAVLGLALL